MYFHPNGCSALDLAQLRVTQVLAGQLPPDAWLHRVVVDRCTGWGAEIRLDADHHFALHFTRRNPTDAVMWDVLEFTCTSFADAFAKLREFVAEYQLCQDEDRAGQANLHYLTARAAA